MAILFAYKGDWANGEYSRRHWLKLEETLCRLKPKRRSTCATHHAMVLPKNIFVDPPSEERSTLEDKFIAFWKSFLTKVS